MTLIINYYIIIIAINKKGEESMKKVTFYLIKKSLPIFLAFLMVIYAVPLSVFANSLTDDSETDEQELVIPSETNSTEKEEPYVLNEVESLRTENSKTFRLSDGTFAAIAYDEPVHYKDENGKWQEYDNTLVIESSENSNQQSTAADDIENTALKAAKSETNIKFAKNSNSSSLVKITNGKKSIKLTLVGSLKTEVKIENQSAKKSNQNRKLTIDEAAKLNNFESSAIYENILENIDLQYILRGGNLKENIIVKAKSDSYTYEFNLDIKGLYPQLESNGSVSLIDEETQDVVYTIPAGYMVDANGERSTAVKYSLEHKNGKSYSLIVTADTSWINDESRAFPVTIDPTIVSKTQAASKDTTISTAVMNQNYGSYTYLDVGDYMGDFWYILLGFDNLPPIPRNSVITEASYINYILTPINGSVDVGVYAIKSAWNETNVTWNTKPVIDNIVVDYFHIDSTTDRFEICITSLVQDWYSGRRANEGITSSNGIALLPLNPYYDNFVSIPSRENTTYSKERYLVVRYRDNKGLEDYWSYHTQNIGKNGTSYIKDYTGNLVYTQKLGIDTGTYPLTINSVYNSYFSNDEIFDYYFWNFAGAYSSYFGKGWQPTTIQAVYSTSDGYVYFDEDGTDHYFKRTLTTDENGNSYYEDEDGLGLQLTYSDNIFSIKNTNTGITLNFLNLYNTIYSIYDGTDTYYFNYESIYNPNINLNGLRLANIKKNNTETCVTFTYDSNLYLTRITGVDGKYAEFTYNTNGTLASIKDANGEVYSFTYYSTGNLLASVKYNTTNYSVIYSYDISNAFYRVNKIQEAVGATLGQAMAITYEDKKTTFRTAGKDDVLADITSSTDLSAIDDILTVYLFDDNANVVTIYTTNMTGTVLYQAQTRSYGNTDTFEAVENNVQVIATTGSGSHNYISNSSFEFPAIWSEKTYGSPIPSAINSYSTAHYFIGSKSLGLYVPYINNSVYGVYQSMTLPAGTYTFSSYVKTVNVGGDGAALSVYNSSNVLLARSETINGTTNTALQNGWRRISVTFTLSSATFVYLHLGLVNATQYAYFDAVRLEKGDSYNDYNLLNNNGFEISDPMYSWSATNYTYDNSGTGLSGTKALKMTGSVTAAKSLTQTVAISRPLGTNFVVSGWAKADSVPTNDTRKFGIEVTIYYNQADPETTYIAFNDNIKTWQYVSQIITPENTTAGDYITNIAVKLIYAYNCNTAYFDNISLTIEGVNKTEDNTDDTTEDTPSEEYPAYEIIDDIRYDYTYDSNHNIIQTVISYVGTDTGSYSNYTSKFYTSAVYNDSNYLLSSTDERGKTTYYTYYSDGKIASETNPNGYTTNYSYANDLLTKLWTTINNTEVSNNFTYNNNGNITGISHKTGDTADLSFSFSYDVFGNLTSISQGTTTLVTYTYNSYNGKLIKIQYANDFIEEYVYDAIDRLSQIKQNSVVKYSYKYDEKSTLLEEIDHSNGTTDKYEYDELGNLIRKYQINTSTKAIKYSKETLYDSEGRVIENTYDVQGKRSTSYAYDDKGNVSTLTLPSGMTYTYNYDVFERLSLRTTTLNGSYVHMPITYTYVSGSGGPNASSHLIESETFGNPGQCFIYQYDNVGNITSISNFITGLLVSYEYDALGQLVRENNVKANKTYKYNYDTKGNLISKVEYSFTTSSTLANPTNTYYSYGNSNNPNLLTNYNGQSISYDNLGNPTNWINLSQLTWNGRKLSSLQRYGDDYPISYCYNADGIRISKTIPYYSYEEFMGDLIPRYQEKYVSYTLDGTKIIKEEHSSTEGMGYPDVILRYYYDANDEIIAFEYNGTYYYYGKNQLGDVKYIYNSNGSIIAEYHYDAWGNIVAITDLSGNALSEGTTAYEVANVNPFRYRSYYYDTETGFYYLNSRYYDPRVGRFINTDVPEMMLLSDNILGTNLFAYCNNNPVNYSDTTGYSPIWYHLAQGLWLLSTGLAAVISAVAKGFVKSALGSISANIIGTLASTALGLLPLGQYWGTIINVTIIITLLWRVKTLLYNIPAGLWHLKQVIKHDHK